MRTLLFAAPLVAVFASTSIAQHPSNGVGRTPRGRVISGLYSVTFGGSELCKEAPSDASTAFDTQFARFQKTYPKLLKLLTEAPEYDQTRRGFSQSLAENRPATTHETRADECKALTHLLQSMLDEPAGRNAVQEYEEILAK